MHIVKKLIPLGAVLASLVGVIGATAGAASAAPVYVKNGTYQFASYTPGTPACRPPGTRAAAPRGTRSR